jgi:hypothetical protein
MVWAVVEKVAVLVPLEVVTEEEEAAAAVEAEAEELKHPHQCKGRRLRFPLLASQLPH